MKKLITGILLALMVLVFFISCQPKIDVNAEQEAIKAVIEGEINASFNGEYEKWASFFVHEPYVLFLQAGKTGYVNLKGWEELSSSAQKWVKPERKGTIILEGNSDYVFSIFEDAAWVSFKTTSSIISDSSKSELIGIEVRTLEKHDGNWKIAYLGSVYSSTYEEDTEGVKTE
jgi:hypothetical protein